MALAYADNKVKRDRDVVRVAVQSDPRALQFAHQLLREDPELVMDGIAKNGTALRFAAEKLQSDRSFVLKATEKNVWSLGCSAMELRSDRSFVLECMKRNNMALEFASAEIKADPAFHAEAIKENSSRLLTNYIKGLQTARGRAGHDASPQQMSVTQWRPSAFQQCASATNLPNTRPMSRSMSLSAIGGAILASPNKRSGVRRA